MHIFLPVFGLSPIPSNPYILHSVDQTHHPLQNYILEGGVSIRNPLFLFFGQVQVSKCCSVAILTKLDAPNLERLRTSSVIWRAARDHGSLVLGPFTIPKVTLARCKYSSISPSVPYLAAFLRSHGDLRLLHLLLASEPFKVLSEVLDSLSLLPNLRYIWTDDVELNGAGGHSEWRVSPNSVQDALHEEARKRPTLHLRLASTTGTIMQGASLVSFMTFFVRCIVAKCRYGHSRFSMAVPATHLPSVPTATTCPCYM